MNKRSEAQVSYGNWMSKNIIYVTALVTIFFLCLIALSIYFIIPGVFFLLITAFFIYSYYQFSLSGGKIQQKVWEMAGSYLKWEGKGIILDIGCGNGALAIKTAKKYREAKITGIDFWESKWGYSQEACENNARIEGVSDRTTFLHASASSLPFEDNYFDAAISNFVFHEVADAKDKRDVIKEALRVVKKDGVFAFHDLFRLKKLYGEMDDLLDTIRSWGIKEVHFADTSDADFIPALLKLPFMLGTAGVIYGRK
jgi:ubiquinone/menaquinone biosynthesis C-methylase UbiE